MPDPKPCLSCGADAQVVTDPLNGWSLVHCTACEMRTDLLETPEDATAAWNDRPVETAMVEEIVRLRALVTVAEACDIARANLLEIERSRSEHDALEARRLTPTECEP